MPGPVKSFPGGFTFINQVAREQDDAGLVGRVSQLTAVREAMIFVQNAATAPDARTRNDLLKRAYEGARTLRAGLSVLSEMIKYMQANYPDVTDPTGGQGVAGVLPPVAGAAQGGPVMTANPAEDASREHDENSELARRVGTDQGMSGGPPRPDTGVDQSHNQVNIPTISEQPLHGPDTYKQDDNPPHGEPNETDEGVGPQFTQAGPDRGSGVTQASYAADRGEASSPGDAQSPPKGQGKAPRKGGR